MNNFSEKPAEKSPEPDQPDFVVPPYPEASGVQFSLTTLFWLTTALAFLFGYARQLGSQATAQAIAFTIFAVMAGAIAGVFSRWKETLFWSAFASLITFVAVAGGRLPNAATGFGWGLAGATCGAFAGSIWPRSPWIGVPMSSVLGCSAMLISLRISNTPIASLIVFDVVVAAIVGAAFWPFIRYLQWLETQIRQPRIVLAAWMTLIMVVGNLLVPILGGVDR